MQESSETVRRQRIKHWLLEKLIPYVRNPRTRSDAQIAATITELERAAQEAKFGPTRQA